MTIEKIANPYPAKERPSQVWTNLEMDKLRKNECLCFNCERTRKDSLYSTCPVAKKIYELCVENNMAMAITRCGATNELGNLLYVPRKK